MNRLLCVLLSVLIVMPLLASCSDDPSVSGGSSSDSSNSGTNTSDYQLPVIDTVSGKVTYAVRDNVKDETELWLESFHQMYPNIEVELVEFVGDLYEFLSTRAASKTLPDVVLGWDNLSTFVSQNWLYPLDEFLEKDAEAAYIHKTSLEGFRYEGKTYAVPAWLQFSCMVVNLDLIDALNLDKPAYDWTIDEFLSLVKAATNNQYSGLNHVDSLDQYLMMQLQGTGHQWGYDPEKKVFNLTDGAFEKAVAYVRDMQKQPQLVADEMKGENRANDDYTKKFGADVDALVNGKILVANQSTWDDSWLNTQLTGFAWDYYPIPAASKETAKQIVHADYGLMLSTAQDPQAAWEFLKFLTFGKDGLITRMNLQNRLNKDGATNNRFTIPSSTHPEVSALFNGYANVPDGVKYMYNHMDVSVKGDYSKILPDYWKVVNDNLWQAKESMKTGTDPAAIARETERKINSDFSAAYENFAKTVQQVQKDFEAHKK